MGKISLDKINALYEKFPYTLGDDTSHSRVVIENIIQDEYDTLMNSKDEIMQGDMVDPAAEMKQLGPNGGAVLVDSLAVAVEIANRYAPEHLQVAVDDSVVDEVVDGDAAALRSAAVAFATRAVADDLDV